MGCRACTASAELERSVLFDDETALACMACGLVRVSTLTVEYSDNPHVDPRTIAKEAQLDPEALAWVASFPRRVRGRDRFMPAETRAATIEALAEAEAKATGLRDAGIPGPPPYGHLAAATAPFQIVWEALAFSPSTPLVTLLARAEPDGTNVSTITRPLALEALSKRPHALAEIAANIHAQRPDAILTAASACAFAPAEDKAAMRAAIESKLARTDPYSSDVDTLKRALAAMASASRARER